MQSNLVIIVLTSFVTRINATCHLHTKRTYYNFKLIWTALNCDKKKCHILWRNPFVILWLAIFTKKSNNHLIVWFDTYLYLWNIHFQIEYWVVANSTLFDGIAGYLPIIVNAFGTRTISFSSYTWISSKSPLTCGLISPYYWPNWHLKRKCTSQVMRSGHI